eukprot:scaffold40135_cov66-Phaeocystis_antarctica.AAC.1
MGTLTSAAVARSGGRGLAPGATPNAATASASICNLVARSPSRTDCFAWRSTERECCRPLAQLRGRVGHK